MNLHVHTLNAFTATPDGGNPAGVCLNGENLTVEQMLRIAAAVGYSETAFVMPSDKADFKVRFFTPSTEVDLCGHATIATFSLMKQLEIIREGIYKQETKAGILNIEISPDGGVMMDQAMPAYGPEIDKSRIAESLNLELSDISPRLPVQVVSTGLPDIIVPVISLNKLNSIRPDLPKITEISREYDTSGYHVFTTETHAGSTAHCRNFAPLCAIDEEAATGTATGALSAYMFRLGLLEKQDTEHLVFEQGYSMNRPSEIRASLDIGNNVITRVRVGGYASGINEMDVDI